MLFRQRLDTDVNAIDNMAIGCKPGGGRRKTERLPAQFVGGDQENSHGLNSIISIALSPRSGRKFRLLFLTSRVPWGWLARLGCLAAIALWQPAAARAQSVLPLPARIDAPSGVLGSITESDLEDARKPLPPAELKAKAGKQDFDLRDSSRALFERVANAFGLNVVFDTQYQQLEHVRFHVTQVNYRDGLRALEAATDSFITPVSEHLIFVARDNSTKRQEYAREVAVAIPIPDPVSVQDIQEVANTVRSTLDIRRLMVDADKRLILIRDVIGKVRPAQIMVRELMHPQPQVMIECDLMAVTSKSQLHYGLSLPTSFPLVAFGSTKYPNIYSSPIPSGVSGFLGFGHGLGFIGIGLSTTTLFASLSKSFATTLDSAEVLASQGLPAELKFGTKYPIVTNQYVGSTTSSAQTFSPPPTVTFEDLGLVLKVLPHIHGLDEVTLDVEASFKVLSGSALNNIPVIADREYKGEIRLTAGQSAVITGLMSATEARTVTGLAGISSIPLINKLLSENTHEKDRDETLIVIKPRIVIPPLGDLSSREIWIGSETRPAETL